VRPLWIAFVALAAAAPQAPAQAGDTLSPTRRFPVGETLVYDGRFGFIQVGQAAMQVLSVDTIRATPTLHVAFLVQGGTFFYRMNDRWDSWIGLSDFASRRYKADQEEGGRRRYNEYEIFPDSGFYRQAGVDSAIATSKDPLDDTAFFYFVRTVPLEVGRRYEFDRYFRPDRNPVVLEVLGRDTIDVPAGRFPTVVIKPTIKGRGILADASEPRMWLSDDDRRIMVQLKTRFPFGVITFRLKSVEHRGPKEKSGR
jgi:hypothetical protein